MESYYQSGSDQGIGDLSLCEVTILLPCLNEADTLAECIKEALIGLKVGGATGEILVADNGSHDGSREIAERLGARLILVEDKGYGNTLRAGINAALGKYTLIADSDLSYDFGHLPRFIQQLREGADFVMGCRFPGGKGTIQPGAMPFLHRWIGNPALSALGRLFFKSHIHDFHCGIRAFRTDKIIALGLTTPGMEFASEMIVKAHLANLKIVEVPTTLRKDGRKRPPHLRTWRDGWRHLRFMLLYSPNWLFLYPGLGFFFIALFIFLRLLPEPLILGGVRFDTNTLLASGTGILVSVQIVFLATFINVYSRTHGLLPPGRFYRKLVRCRPFESGLALGFTFGLVGFIYFAAALLRWKFAGFGDLPHAESLRLVIPALVLIGLAVQFAFAGFVLAVLGIQNSAQVNVEWVDSANRG